MLRVIFRLLLSIVLINCAAMLSAVTLTDSSDYDPILGRYNIRMGMAKPKFNKIKFYSNLYGSEGFTPFFAIKRNYRYGKFAIGWGFGFNYYNDSGNAAKKVKEANPSASSIVRDVSSPTSLTLVPYRFTAEFQYAPFNSPWFMIDFWWGLEDLYFQEVRLNPDVKTESDSATTSTSSSTTATSTTENLVAINSGWNANMIFGVAFNFLINRFGQQSVLSMKRVLDFDKVYLSPYFETTAKSPLKTTIFGKQTSSASFLRSSIGIAVTFVSTR